MKTTTFIFLIFVLFSCSPIDTPDEKPFEAPKLKTTYEHLGGAASFTSTMTGDVKCRRGFVYSGSQDTDVFNTDGIIWADYGVGSFTKSIPLEVGKIYFIKSFAYPSASFDKIVYSDAVAVMIMN